MEAHAALSVLTVPELSRCNDIGFLARHQCQMLHTHTTSPPRLEFKFAFLREVCHFHSSKQCQADQNRGTNFQNTNLKI